MSFLVIYRALDDPGDESIHFEIDYGSATAPAVFLTLWSARNCATNHVIYLRNLEYRQFDRWVFAVLDLSNQAQIDWRAVT